MPVTNVIAAVLVGLMVNCPFLCLGEASSTASWPVWTACQGTCCSSEAPCEGVPSDDRPSNEGSDCLCHGAVLAGPVEMGHRMQIARDAIPAFQLTMDADSILLGHCRASAGPSDRGLAGNFRPLSTGRDILLATASLLL
ncbi:MAG: hypothetical protein ACC645_22945 [Pirellulales bacterium]